MAVETRYVVIRTNKEGEELELKTFTDKRSADNYDKMLDMADSLYDVLEGSELQFDEGTIEELSIFLAQNRDDVLVALQAKKKIVNKNKPDEKQKDLLNPDADISTKSLSESILNEGKEEQAKEEAKTDADNNLVDFVIEKDDAA